MHGPVEGCREGVGRGRIADGRAQVAGAQTGEGVGAADRPARLPQPTVDAGRVGASRLDEQEGRAGRCGHGDVGDGGEPALQVPPVALIPGSTAIQGHASGTSRDSEDTLRFSALTGVKPTIETLPLERAQEAYDKMMAGDARFRMVLTMD